MLHIQTVEPNTLELLKKLMSESWLNDFRLVGGTSLSLQIGHRISVDLDFFTNSDFDVDNLLELLLENNYKIQIIHRANSTLILNIDGTKVDFIKFRYNFLSPMITIEKIRMAPIQDIACLKIDAIAGRGAMKDFYDLYFILQHFTLKEVLDWYSEMYKHQTLFHILKSLTYFEDAEDNALPIIFDEKISWALVKQQIAVHVKTII